MLTGIFHGSVQFRSVAQSCPTLRPHEPQYTRPLCPSPTPGVHPNPCPLSCSLLLLPSIFPSIRVFSNESALHIRWRKFWSFSFSISPTNEYSGLISFRMDWFYLLTVQFSSVAQSCLTLCNPMNHSTPGLPVHHQLPEFTQTHIHRVSDAIQPSHPLSSPSPPAPNPSQHQSLFQ